MNVPAQRIDRTALIDAKAELADDVVVETFAILEGNVRLGPGCRIRPGAHLIGPIVMGRDNLVGSNTVIGDRPQHLGYRDEPTGVTIGDGNRFGAKVTIHRGTSGTGQTHIGDNNRFLTGSHVGHDCHIGNGCAILNNALIGGHCVLGDGASVSRNAAVHQCCQLGKFASVSATSMATKDVPPFVVLSGFNNIAGVNISGLRRGGLDAAQIAEIHRLFEIVYRCGLNVPNAMKRLEEELGPIEVVREFVDFVRSSKRGISVLSSGKVNHDEIPDPAEA